MTVREAIEKLSTLDQDMPMLTRRRDGGFLSSGMEVWSDFHHDATQLSVIKVAPRSPGQEYWPCFRGLTARNTVNAVILE